MKNQVCKKCGKLFGSRSRKKDGLCYSCDPRNKKHDLKNEGVTWGNLRR